MFANNLNKLILIISFNLFSYHVLSQNNILVSSINSENNPAIILKSNSNLFLGIFKYEFQISNLTKDTLYLFSMPSKEMSTYFGINYLKNNKNTYEVYPDDKDKNTLTHIAANHPKSFDFEQWAYFREAACVLQI
ncbi:MAG: hypothetical protein EAZ27_02050 [Cytophagales bacterium]|nr:MAG: hypothetical protein EAZ27_02050 [Cytophagales bacterium]